jgi:hypothetical protein
MTQEQFRIDVQNAVKNYVQQFMQQNQVPAAMMEDAMNAALLDVKSLVYSQLIAANQQEAVAAQEAAQKQETILREVEEEENGTDA